MFRVTNTNVNVIIINHIFYCKYKKSLCKCSYSPVKCQLNVIFAQKKSKENDKRKLICLVV